MKAYDFDGTLYRGDSSIDFYLFCLKNNPRILKYLPLTIVQFLLYRFGRCSKKEFKQCFFRFLLSVENPQQTVCNFWALHSSKLKPILAPCKDDLIISASPYFLLKPICNQLGVEHLIATSMNPQNGIIYGDNCFGNQKARLFKDAFPNQILEEFYSDSRQDAPMAALAQKSFLVKKNKIQNWN